MGYTEEILKIARFMGIEPIKGFNVETGNYYYYYNNVEMQGFEALPFYNTWDEIMPVVEKIENINSDCELTIIGNYVEIGDEGFVSYSKLESIIKAVNWWASKHIN